MQAPRKDNSQDCHIYTRWQVISCSHRRCRTQLIFTCVSSTDRPFHDHSLKQRDGQNCSALGNPDSCDALCAEEAHAILEPLAAVQPALLCTFESALPMSLSEDDGDWNFAHIFTHLALLHPMLEVAGIAIAIWPSASSLMHSYVEWELRSDARLYRHVPSNLALPWKTPFFKLPMYSWPGRSELGKSREGIAGASPDGQDILPSPHIWSLMHRACADMK